MGSNEEVSAVVIAHPGGIEFPKDFEVCIRPTLFLCAELEHIFPNSDRDGGKEILEKRGIYNKFVIYPGCTHGFAVSDSKTFADILDSGK
jgi:dienelactone hydrolase